MRSFQTTLLLGILIFASGYSTKRATAQEVKVQKPTINAVRVSTAPVIDGVVRGESVWDQIPASTGFIQTAPSDGEPATQKTDVRIGFSNDILYIGVVMFDSDPSGLITADSRRDASLDESDSFRFILDTYSDAQNGFVFGTNVGGAEYDAQYIGSSGGGSFGGRYRGGSGGGLNVNWDASWEVATIVYRGRMERRICYSVFHAPVSIGRKPDVGRQL